jgi:hypothetical protein
VNGSTDVLGEPRRYLAITAVMFLGLIGGVWTVLVPFVLNWPLRPDGSWTDAIRDITITGIVITAVSAIGVVVTAGFAARSAAEANAVVSEESS